MPISLRDYYLQSSLHPADALAEIRESINELKRLKEELRKFVAENPDHRTGRSYKVEIEERQHCRLSKEKVMELVEDINQVMECKTITYVKTVPIDQQSQTD